MKTYLVLLSSLIAVSIAIADNSQKTSLQILVTPSKDRVRVSEKFDVVLSVKNISKKLQSFRVMNCGWLGHWKSNNQHVSWRIWKCLKNSVITFKLKPGEVYEKKLKMFVLGDAKSKSVVFRMGFTPLSENYGEPSSKKYSEITYWSNEITIHIVRGEQPD